MTHHHTPKPPRREMFGEVEFVELAPVVEALTDICNELGVPSGSYPYVVANAAEIARSFLTSLD